MKLLELKIHNIRGIRDLHMTPDGKNMVLWGPNGSGKSSVVDAIDFLLTGNISRLTGRGTGSIRLSEHGRHIDSASEDAWVRGVLELPGWKKPVEISRCVAHPGKLECTPASARSKLEAILTLAQRGQHVLTRREILKFITAQPKNRAEQIQELLDLAEVENTRQALVKVTNNLKKEAVSAQLEVKRAEGTVNATLQLKSFDAKAALQEVNRLRALLGGQPVDNFAPSALKDGLPEPLKETHGKRVNRGLYERYTANLQAIFAPKKHAQIAASDRQLREHLSEIRRDQKLLEALHKYQLIELGLGLLDKSGSCPLCETPWAPGTLKTHLEKRLADAQAAAKLQQKITNLSAALSEAANTALASLQSVAGTARQVALPEEDLAALQTWAANLQQLTEALSSPLESYPLEGIPVKQVQCLLAPENAGDILVRVGEQVAAASPPKSPELDAWDTLTKLEENLTRLQQAQKRQRAAALAARRAEQLQAAFLAARTRVLKTLYDDIRKRFEDLYRQLHGPDESGFTAVFEPTDAGLDLAVDFHGRGTHPPHALHSEGHQDSMGICLYLALAERLSEGKLDLIILDDVMMSIDADHRRGLANLLAQAFPNKQFLITTHDKTWASELQHGGVVSSKNMIELFNWDVTTGPLVNMEAGLWNRIREDLENNDVPAAAAKLRRNSEMFFGMVCDALQAQVTYKRSGRWELGDFMPAAKSRYKDLLKKAKVAAQSWDDSEALAALSDLDSQMKQVYDRTNAEQWAVNASVHYNNWADLSPKEFQPVVDAFQDLYGLFTCSRCGGLLTFVAAKGQQAVRCNCTATHWNLTKKQKPS